MSLARSKTTRNVSPETKSQKPPTSGHKPPLNRTPTKSEKKNSPSQLKKPVPQSPSKLRSLSQPSHSSNILKHPNRPRSGGDEKDILVSKFKHQPKNTVSEESEADDCEYRSSTFFSKGLDDEINEEVEGVKICSSNVKSSASGIPLRIKQRPQTPKVSPRRATPRTPRSNNVAYQQSRGGLTSPSNIVDSKSGLTARRALETQFQVKKKKLELLKKQIDERQKPLMEQYHSLVQIKKKLENYGETKVSLDDIKLVSFNDVVEFSSKDRCSDESMSNLSKTSSLESRSKIQIDPEIIFGMKDLIRQVPVSLTEVCKNLMTKRLSLFEFIKKLSSESVEPVEIEHSIMVIKNETADLERVLEDTFMEQEKRVAELVDKWQILLQGNGDCASFANHMEQLQEQLKVKEQKLNETMSEINEIKRKTNEEGSQHEITVKNLKDKIKSLEDSHCHDRTVMVDQKEKNGLLEQKFKTLKNRSKEVEEKKKEAEIKLIELQKQYKSAVEQLKLSEHRWNKEKEDMLTKHKHDKQILDKLTKDRSVFETRMKTVEEMNDEWQNKYMELQMHAEKEIDEARTMMTKEKTERESLQQMYESTKKQIVDLEVKSKQALDLVKKKSSYDSNEEGVSTEREAELYAELLATRIALKSAEDQINSYSREKMRFIDTIQALQDSQDNDRENLAQSLTKNVQKLTELETQLKLNEEIVCNQRIEIDNLRIECDNLKQRADIPCSPNCDVEAQVSENDLRSMLYEGKLKLEQSLKKSLDNEHKIIRYEHELNRQSKKLCEMENLLKVRDGLISMIKAKKDELQVENDSWKKYANEIHELLLQAKQEALCRSELVDQLTHSLDSRTRMCELYERKTRELEECVNVANEKRFKLQDTLEIMERELQSTKAHINKLAPEVKSRYGINLNISSNSYTDRLFPKPQTSSNLFSSRKVNNKKSSRNMFRALSVTNVIRTNRKHLKSNLNNEIYGFNEDLHGLQKVIENLTCQTNNLPNETNNLIADQTLSPPSQNLSSSTWFTSEINDNNLNIDEVSTKNYQGFLPLTKSTNIIKPCRSNVTPKVTKGPKNVDARQKYKRYDIKPEEFFSNAGKYEPCIQYCTETELKISQTFQSKMSELINKTKESKKNKFLSNCNEMFNSNENRLFNTNNNVSRSILNSCECQNKFENSTYAKCVKEIVRCDTEKSVKTPYVRPQSVDAQRKENKFVQFRQINNKTREKKSFDSTRNTYFCRHHYSNNSASLDVLIPCHHSNNFCGIGAQSSDRHYEGNKKAIKRKEATKSKPSTSSINRSKHLYREPSKFNQETDTTTSRHEDSRQSCAKLGVERVTFIKHTRNISRHLNKKSRAYSQSKYSSQCDSSSSMHFADNYVNRQVCALSDEVGKVFDGTTLTSKSLGSSSSRSGQI